MPVPLHDLAVGPVRLALLPHAGGRGESAARAWLAAGLGLAPDALALPRDAHGRPALGRPGRDCNWSHSGDRLLVALAEGARVGVDLELRRPRPKALEIARRYFHPQEAVRLAALDGREREAAFLRLWCAKEAVLKAHGRGLAHGLGRFGIAGFEEAGAPLRLAVDDGALGRGWRLRAFDWPEAIAVVAWRPDP
ncbi:4'-phosphopantetheinyl transferase superfamily protein [Lysobacter sp. N42]|jgi:4'-phosphopantetheinyl transferase|uniref:4'-phosphopantetheinyl transferase family protein n=1 Tax=Lysobacter sp. N42 TaxID=2545719 RepID=UPI00104C3A43|nr:4'-phosphopantetheinyl transferase superfamily protein [Lysobacter sp. N42]TCZ82231.1 4'-phosphopantetheinyl transferase superfamily protein [Lysobacter sp. N42]